MAKNRSRRLRKKLHVDEFKENYIQISFKLKESTAALMDLDAWCDLHDTIFDELVKCGVEPGTGYSVGNEVEFSFTQKANESDATIYVADAIRACTDVDLDMLYATLPVDAWHWQGWYLAEPFDLLEDLAFVIRPKNTKT